MKKGYVLTFISFCFFLNPVLGQTLKSVVNKYTAVTAPATISAGSLSLNVSDATIFQSGSRALLIQMKGASVSTVAATYGNITAINNAGNFEFVDIASVSGNTVNFQRCLQKNYTTSGLVQLISVPKYTGNQTVITNDSISAIRVYNKGYGYTTPPTVTISAPTGTPAGERITATAVAELDAFGQVKAIRLTNRGRKYISNPTVTIGLPPAPYAFGVFRALAVASRGLTGMQWDGEKGGVLAFEVDGDLALSDSILMNGMGFGGGSVGTGSSGIGCITTDGISFGTVPPPASAPEASLAQSGVKGESIAIQTAAQMRGRGKFSTGGGAGCRGEAGGGGGANFGDGGYGGKAGAGGATLCNNTNTPSGRPASGTASFGYGEFDNQKIFLGGGGGGGHAFNGTFSSAGGNNAGGFGGGIIIISANSITGNGRAIKSNGGSCATIASDGASGGGGGGVVLLDCDSFSTTLIVQAQGGKGGNTDRISCCPTVCTSACNNKEGPGGGGGGGVVWLKSTGVPTGVSISTLAGTGGLCIDQGNDPYGAAGGTNGTTLFQLYLLKGQAFQGSTFTVGPVGTLPRPNFSTIKQAASYVSYFGAASSNITFDVLDGTYPEPVAFTALTDGCNPTGGTLTVQSNSANPANVIMSATSDVVTVTGLAGLTLKDISCNASTTTTRSILVTGTSLVNLENVEVQGNLEIDQTGTNTVELKNTSHRGNIELETGESLTVSGTTKIIGQASSNRSLILSSGSTLTQTANSVIDLEGSNWTNNGASLFLDDASSTRFSGGFAMVVGGTSTTAFRRVLVSNTNSISIGNSLSMKKWLQTSNVTASAGTYNLTITDSILTGTGQISHTTGKVTLTNPGYGPAIIQGRFYSIDLNNSNHHLASGDITVDNGINLNSGLLNMAGNTLSVENSASSSLGSAVGSWITGTVKRRVSTDNYTFPIGVSATKEPVFIGINSLSGGMQYLSASFTSGDPMQSPTSTFVPQTEGLSEYSGLINTGFWTLSPDAGSANYELRLFPSFTGAGTAPFTFYKRPAASTIWNLYGTLSNPESTFGNIQSDGSLRRTGLTGFSDFAIAESGSTPLPMHFISFNARPGSKGVMLRWKMGDCEPNDRFTVLRGKNHTALSKVNLDIKSLFGCSDYQTIDPGPRSGVWFYKVQANSEKEGTLYSDLQRVDFKDAEKSLLTSTGTGKNFILSGPDFENGFIRISDLSGKTLIPARQVKQGQHLDFSTLPAGSYFSIFELDGQRYQQKFIVW